MTYLDLDPNKALADARKAAEYLASQDTDVDEVTALVESFQALDEWMSNGMFKPDDWEWGDDT